MDGSLDPQIATEETETKTDLTPPEVTQKEVLLSDYLSEDFSAFLIAAMNKGHAAGKRVLTLADFAADLLSEPAVQAYNTEHKTDTAALLESLKKNDMEAKNLNGRMIIVDPELKAQILRSYAFATKNNEFSINLLNFWRSLLNLAEDRKKNALSAEMPLLSKYAIPLAPAGENEIVDRDNEVNQILRSLMKPDKNDLVLVGDFGIGKTSIVRKVARELKTNEQLEAKWHDYTILQVNLSEIISIAKYQQEMFNSLIKDLEKATKKIFYFPNIDLEPIGKEPFVIEFIFTGFLKNPENRVIIGSSNSTYQNIINRVSLFGREYESLNINEPLTPDLEKIIQNRLDKYKAENSISFSENFKTDLIDLSKRFITDKVFPHKALNLLEEIVVNAGIHNKTELTDAEIKEVLAQKTGIPIETLNAGDKATLLGLGEELEKVVVGQEVAVKSVVQSIQRSRVGLKNPNRPIGSFLFMGPTGVGKTEFAKQLARLYFQDEKAFMRFDMSEYSEAHTSQKLIGAPPGYMGYEEGGTLTNYVLHKPYCLLLFDEVEKAHPRIFDLFLQILDDGRLTDSKGQLVNFTNTILIFTSNIGSDKIATEAANPASLLYSDPTSFFADHIVPLLKDFLRIELINRFDEVIPFLPLNKEKITRILMLKLEKLKAAVAKQGYKIEFAPADLQKLAELCYSPVFGAREIDRMLNKYVENPVTEILLHNSAKPGDTIYWKFAQ